MLGLWVILHHLTGERMLLGQWNHGLAPALRNLLRGGYLGVQTFFVLSGFVLAQSYARTRWNRETLARFAMARVARIYPVYLVSLAIVSWFMLTFALRGGIDVKTKITTLGGYAFVLQGWAAPRTGWNTPAWSLSCELFFYLCFPLLLIWLGRCRMLWIWSAAAVAMVTPMALAHAGVPPVWKPVHHLADFVAGIASARVYRWLASSRRIPGWMGMVLVCGAFIGGTAFIVNPDVLTGTIANLNTVLRPLNMALLIGLALGGGWLGALLSASATEYLGRVSYSMYILHVPVLWWYSAYTTFRWGSTPPSWVGLAFIALVIAVSIAAYEFVEVPANQRIRQWTERRFARESRSELRLAAWKNVVASRRRDRLLAELKA